MKKTSLRVLSTLPALAFFSLAGASALQRAKLEPLRMDPMVYGTAFERENALTAAADYSHECNLPAGTKKVSIFIDLNGSVREMNAAGAAACARGEKFMTIPSIEAIEKVGNQRIITEAAKSRFSEMDSRFYSYPEQFTEDQKAELENRRQKWLTEDANLNRVSDPYMFNPGPSLATLLDTLDQRQLKVTSITLSGHHVSDFYGDLANRHIKTETFLDQIHSHATLFSNIDFLGFWGCGGLTREAVSNWTAAAPSLKVVAGFYGSAPLGIRPASGRYLYGAMTKTKELSAATSRAQVGPIIHSIRGVDDTLSAIYIRSQNPGHSFFFYNSRYDESTQRMETSLEDFGDQSRCVVFRESLQQMQSQINGYMNGEIPLPVDNASSPLKRLYFDIMQNRDCLSDGTSVESTYLLSMLRFFETGVKMNFAQTFKAQLNAAKAELQPSAVDRIIDQMQADADRAYRDQLAGVGPLPMSTPSSRPLSDAEISNDPRFRDSMARAQSEYSGLKSKIQRKLSFPSDVADLERVLAEAQSQSSSVTSKARGYLDALNEAKDRKNMLRGVVSTPAVDARAEAQKQAIRDSAEQNRREATARIASARTNLPLILTSVRTVLSDLPRQNRGSIMNLWNVWNSRDVMNYSLRNLAVLPETNRAMALLNLYLVQLQEGCMDFERWHEYHPGTVAQAQCSVQ